MKPTWRKILLNLLLAVFFAACGQPRVVGPAGDFSWQAESQMIWPVRGTIVSTFADSSRASHQGVDLAAKQNEPLVAALGGRVDYIGSIAGYGNVIALTHGPHRITIYAHVAEPQVRQGETVSRGQPIASIGPEGFVHFEVRESKQAVDPETLIAFAPSPPAGGAIDFSRTLAEKEPSGGSLAGVLGARRVSGSLPPPPAPAPIAAVADSADSPPKQERSGWASFGLGAVLVGSNLFYVPAKLGYAGAGALVGGVALLLAHDSGVASEIWTPTVGGDYFVTERHFRGETPLRFFGQGAADTNSRATSSADRRSPSMR